MFNSRIRALVALLLLSWIPFQAAHAQPAEEAVTRPVVAEAVAPLTRVRFIPVAQAAHPLHQVGRELTLGQ